MLIYDLKIRENMILYFSLKEKHGYSLPNRDEMISIISLELENKIYQYDHIFIPESSSDFLYKVVELTGKSFSVVFKNDKEYIKSKIPEFNLQKAERISHEKEIEFMDGFKINELKANHRKHYIPHLFKTQQSVNNSIIVDDSNFSGCTRQALIKSTGTTNYIAIFSKEEI